MIALHYTEGLIPVIVQDKESRQVLMFAYANEHAIRLTRETGYAHFSQQEQEEALEMSPAAKS